MLLAASIPKESENRKVEVGSARNQELSFVGKLAR